MACSLTRASRWTSVLSHPGPPSPTNSPMAAWTPPSCCHHSPWRRVPGYVDRRRACSSRCRSAKAEMPLSSVVPPRTISRLGTGQPRLRLLEWLRAQPTRPRFAVVHAFSTHNLLVRYWLALGGADPDKDIETIVIPPEDVIQALAAGSITGFCAGAPWGDLAERQDIGRVLVGTSVIWPFHPEKCLAVSAAWAEENPHLMPPAARRHPAGPDQLRRARQRAGDRGSVGRCGWFAPARRGKPGVLAGGYRS